MTSRQTGRRISQLYKKRGGSRTARRKPAPMTAAEQRRMAQFLFCGAVFVLLVAVKLFLPSKMQALGPRLDGLLERNMDVTEVFSAVGRVFAGETEDGWGTLYRSVFQPEQETAVETAAAPEPGTAAVPIPTADGAHKADEAGDAAPQPSPAADEPPESAVTQELSYIVYSDKTLPDNVSLEQQILGFDYSEPVMGTLSSKFGYRTHPLEGEEAFHYGLDLAAEEGADIAAFADGDVTAVGESSSYGKYLIITHENGISSLYAHCSRVTATSGSAVRKGDKVAEVGQTGAATGPHLHFELHAGSTYLDPIYYVSPA